MIIQIIKTWPDLLPQLLGSIRRRLMFIVFSLQMPLIPLTRPALFLLDRPRIRPVSFPVFVFLRSRCYGTNAFVFRGALRPPSSATVGRPLWTEKKLEEITHTAATEASLLFGSASSSLDSVDDLDGETGLKASAKSRAVYDVLRMDKEGRSSRMHVQRRDLLRAHGLKPRDLWCIEPLWDKPQSAHSFVIKSSAFLVSLFGVSCLVSEDRVLLFDPKSTPARTFLKVVTPRLRALAGSNRIKSLPNTRDDLDDSCQDTTIAPFELEVLESILSVALSQLESELHEVLQQAFEVLSVTPSEVNSSILEQIRMTKQEGVELKCRAEALKELLEEVLDDEDRLLRLNLSNYPHQVHYTKQQQSHSNLSTINGVAPYKIDKDSLTQLQDDKDESRGVEEVKDLLEYYKQRAGTVDSETHRILIRVRDLETSINISLSAKRYEVGRLGLTLSVATATAALSAKMWGVLGTNLEMSSMGFDEWTHFIIISCFHIFAFFSNNEG